MSSRLGRRFALAVAATVLLVGTASCSPAGSAAATPSTKAGETSAPLSDEGTGTYLALGDSVPFGFRGGLSAEYRDPTNFVGYPELVGADLGLDVINATCPGETTASFLDVTAQSNGCENTPDSPAGYRSKFPLHVAYDSTDETQLDFALKTLTETDDVELVTLQIGANDGFLCQQASPSRCTAPAEVQNLAGSVGANLDRILKGLREQFDGQIVVVTYYAIDYGDQVGAATQVLDNGIAQVAAANGAKVADGYAAFQQAATAAGGSSVDAGLVLPNDVHPSDAGQRVLAQAVEAVVSK